MADTSKLYTTALLSLSAELSQFPLRDGFANYAEARSKTCGSIIRIGMNSNPGGAIGELGMQVSACAVGQSSAALLARNAPGKSLMDLESVLESIEEWLTGEGPVPDWPGFDALSAAKDHPGRHDALRLPWKAAIKALSQDIASR